MKKMLSFVLVAILCAGIVSTFSACSDKPSAGGDAVSVVTGEKETSNPEYVVKLAFDELKKGNLEEAAKYVDVESLLEANLEGQDEGPLSAEGAALSVVNRLEMKILSSNVTDDTATVKASFTTVDVGMVMSKQINSLMEIAMAGAQGGDEVELPDDEGIRLLLLKHIKEVDATITHEYEMKLEKNDDSWIIVVEPELTNAVLGGVIDLLKG